MDKAALSALLKSKDPAVVSVKLSGFLKKMELNKRVGDKPKSEEYRQIAKLLLDRLVKIL